MPLAPQPGDTRQFMIHESDLLRSLVSGQCSPEDPARSAAKELQGRVSPDDPITSVQKVLEEDNVAVVMDNGRLIGIVSKIDLIEYLTASHR